MKESTAKRLILVTALEAELQGMIADNKMREHEGLSMAYTGADFNDISEQMRELAEKHEDQL